LLEEAQVAAEAAAVNDDVWEQLRLDALCPERWKKAVGSMSLHSAYNDSRTQELAVVIKKDQNPAGVFAGEEERGGERSGPGAAGTILLALLFHTISARPPKQPRMVRTLLKVHTRPRLAYALRCRGY
jgi:hypothetical protein